VSVVALRPVEDSDLEALFGQMRDPESVRMAAFTSEDPGDRSAFDTHMARLRSFRPDLRGLPTRRDRGDRRPDHHDILRFLWRPPPPAGS
jgi:hypothetical protein